MTSCHTSTDSLQRVREELETEFVNETNHSDHSKSMSNSHVYYDERKNVDKSEHSQSTSLSNSVESHGHVQSQQVSKSSVSAISSSTRLLTVRARKRSTAAASGKLLEQMRSSATNYRSSGGASAQEVWTWIRNRSKSRATVQNFDRKLPQRPLALGSVNSNMTSKKERHHPVAPRTGRDTLCLLHLMYRTSEHNRHAAEQLLRQNGLPSFAQPQVYNQYNTLFTATSSSTSGQSTTRERLKLKTGIRAETSELSTAQSILTRTTRTPCDEKCSHSQGDDHHYTLPFITSSAKHRAHLLHKSAVAPRGTGPFSSGQPTMWRMPQLE
ncbi:uncharacterized protein LOC134197093 isoform X2 [Corticium candelabrum]|uniref:uncharacterized protein LOC134197093 isoform X2 n=1 Tax=Corticium candelabrum TaxID=121492 RepID=UPI002E267D81|nr:uncharacterized protein LOC134197093 isoform X2 [Corticium candelabrum]